MSLSSDVDMLASQSAHALYVKYFMKKYIPTQSASLHLTSYDYGRIKYHTMNPYIEIFCLLPVITSLELYGCQQQGG